MTSARRLRPGPARWGAPPRPPAKESIEITPAGSFSPAVFTPEALAVLGEDRGRLLLFTGYRGLIPLGHDLAAWRLFGGESVVFVDGANAFDVARLARRARTFGRDARPLLARIHLSRAFTVHQLEAVIGERLGPALAVYESRLALVSGMMDTFCDEAVPLWEASRILHRVMGALRRLAERGHRVVVLAPDPPAPADPRRELAPILARPADRIFALTEKDGRLTLEEKTRPAGGARWELPPGPFGKRRGF